jgi:hypothetical protein
MPLINLTTNLKSLKFGNDQSGGGSSNQPYVQTPIPEKLEESGYGFLDQDFILRGGSKAITDSLIDVERLGKYFIDIKNPSGLLFIAKQFVLSRTAVKTQTSGFFNEGIYTPLSTLTQAGGNAFGIHVNKQGLNPFASTGPTSKNEDLYGVKVKPTQELLDNRLVDLYGAKFLTIAGATIKKEYLKNDISDKSLELLSYGGGPGSVLGIGKTNIALSNPTSKPNYQSVLLDNKINYLTLGYPELSNYDNLILPQFTNGRSTIARIGVPSYTRATAGTELVGANVATFQVVGDDEGRDSLTNFREFKNYIPSARQNDFRKNLILAIAAQNNSITTIMSSAPSYDSVLGGTIEQRVRLGDPGNASGKNLFSYTSGSATNTDPTLQGPLGAASVNSYDKINILPIYSSTTVLDNKITNDLVQFKIGVYNFDAGNTFNNIHFRAFLNQISDAYTADWNDTRYIGRGEKFYTYGGFDRKISLSWTVAAQSKAELMPMYKKLNYLASVCAPNYSANGYMRGNIVKLTIGGYIHDQPGIITGFSYEMNEDDATWEIGIDDNGGSDTSVKELPHLIKVSGFNFIPIHNFVPQTQEITVPSGSSPISLNKPYIDGNAYGKEKFIN